MRGNEMQELPGRKWIASGFLIPMRGNENVYPRFKPSYLDEVSDPHEG